MQLTPLSFAALALLVERPMHPYEMFQTLISRSGDRVVKVRPGSLYHTVDRLAAADLVHALGTERAGNRPERTSYEITEAGRDALRTQLVTGLAEVAEEYPQFPLMLSEAANLEPELFCRLLETRSLRVRGYVQSFSRACEHLSAKGLNESYWLDVTYLRDRAAAELDWIERTLVRIRSGELGWTTDPEPVPTGTAHA